MITGNTLSLIVVIFCVGLIIFLLVREVICWYWKINERLILQQKILDEQVKTNNALNSILFELKTWNWGKTNDINLNSGVKLVLNWEENRDI